MRRSVDMLIKQHALVADAAYSALLFMGLGTITSVGSAVIFSGAEEVVIGELLGAALLFSLASMIGATYVIARSWRRLDDLGTFLMIIWLLPYIGVAF